MLLRSICLETNLYYRVRNQTDKTHMFSNGAEFKMNHYESIFTPNMGKWSNFDYCNVFPIGLKSHWNHASSKFIDDEKLQVFWNRWSFWREGKYGFWTSERIFWSREKASMLFFWIYETSDWNMYVYIYIFIFIYIYHQQVLEDFFLQLSHDFFVFRVWT